MNSKTEIDFKKLSCKKQFESYGIRYIYEIDDYRIDIVSIPLAIGVIAYEVIVIKSHKVICLKVCDNIIEARRVANYYVNINKEN